MRMNDLPEVLAIEKKSFPTPWRSADFLSQARRKEAESYVAVQGRTVVGYAVMAVEHGDAHLMNFAVKEEYRRSGIGTRLMMFVLGQARAARCNKVHLEVRERNLAAQLFYKKMGYRASKILKNYYADTGEDAYVMEMTLP